MYDNVSFMIDRKPDIEADKKAAEVQSQAKQREELADLALQLTARSTALRSSLPEGIVTALSHLVRSMNCYYSNLIEGHDTHPIDIERALNKDFSVDPEQASLKYIVAFAVPCRRICCTWKIRSQVNE